jgi:hypothetical protein
MQGCSEALIVSFGIGFPSTNPIPPKQQKFGCTGINFEIEAPISTWRLSVNDFKRMNNESYIRITLSNLATLLARANVLVSDIYKFAIHSHLERGPLVPRLWLGSSVVLPLFTKTDEHLDSDFGSSNSAPKSNFPNRQLSPKFLIPWNCTKTSRSHVPSANTSPEGHKRVRKSFVHALRVFPVHKSRNCTFGNHGSMHIVWPLFIHITKFSKTQKTSEDPRVKGFYPIPQHEPSWYRQQKCWRTRKIIWFSVVLALLRMLYLHLFYEDYDVTYSIYSV